ncbi:heterodisulfide reductase, subunit B [bacterium]|nr:heterodisulfide reductase, subunit B [bacterium]
MKLGYYPGCTLKTKAINLEVSAVKSLEALGVEVEELERWNCCGAVYSLADDDLVHLLAPVRDLIRAKDQGLDKVMTLCSMCYNTIARANLLMRKDEEKRDAINNFLEEETDYFGEVDVVHYLQFVRDDIGWDKVAAAVKNPLKDLKVGPYYGCTLTKPGEIKIDDSIEPVSFKNLIEAIGAEYVAYPDAETCCGSYQIIGNPEAALKTTATIVESAEKRGADALILSCPLCEYNIGRRQADVRGLREGLEPLPVFYFTQLLAIALGLDIDTLHLDRNMPEAQKLLEDKGILATA